MYNFEKIHLSNYELWDDQEFTFEPGVTHVTGGNRSGKSLLFSSLAPILYNSDVVPKSGRATLTMSTETRKYDFTAFNQSTKNNKFSVAIDDKEMHTETIAAARNLIDKHFTNNIQESIFETTVSLSGLKQHPLATGKPATRLDWVHETLAYASLLDGYIEDVEHQIKTTRENSIKFNLLRDQIRGMEVVEKPIDNVEGLKAKLVAIRSNIAEIEQIQRDLRAALNFKGISLEKPKLEFMVAKTRLARAIEAVDALMEARKRHQNQAEQLFEYKALKKKLGKQADLYKEECKRVGVKILPPNVAFEKYGRKSKELQEQLRIDEKTQRVYAEQTEVRRFVAKHRDLKLKYKRVEDYERVMENIRERMSITKARLKAHDNGEEHCSVCGSNLKVHEKDIERLREMLENDKGQLERTKELLKLLEARQVILVDEPETITGTLLIENYKKLVIYSGRWVELKEELDGMDKPEEVEFDPDALVKAEKQVQHYQTALAEAKAYREAKRKLESMDGSNKYNDMPEDKIKAKIEAVETKLAALYDRQSEINDKIVTSQTDAALYSKYIREKKQLITNAKELKHFERDHKILSALRKALGRDGFRTKRLESTLALFVDNLNEFAPLLWKEPFKFEIETGPRKCNVVIHRNRKAGNAFTLSGSERRCWQLLAAISMLRLLPANRRTNTIILDELEANMDIASRNIMMQDFIPELNKVVPNVIIVSPLTTRELGLQPDISYQVTKKSAKSKLIRI